MGPDSPAAGRVPRLGCDCHVHVFGSLRRFPQVGFRAYTAPVADLETLRAAATPVGITRFVVVQPSVYGDDTRCLGEALEALGGNGRGVIGMSPEAASARRLDQEWARGTRGVRVNLYSHRTTSQSGSASLIAQLRAWFDALPRGGWHIEVIAPLQILVDAAAVIEASPVPVVVDHYGLPGAEAPDSPCGRRLLETAALPHVWFKLSAPYRTLQDPLATHPPVPWLHALASAAPDRVLWGSDWPHTPPHESAVGGPEPDSLRSIDYARLVGDFVETIGGPAIADAIFVTNPARLYGFA